MSTTNNIPTPRGPEGHEATTRVASGSRMPTAVKASAAVLAVVALSLGTLGTAVAGPSAVKLTASKVKKIVKKEVAKAAPTLSVKHADTATTATSATTATTATTVDGKSVAQLKTVVASASTTLDVADIGAGTDVATVSYTLVAPSKVVFSGVAELQGDGSTGDEARCILSNDDVNVSPGYETTFDDSGAAGTNPASIAVLGNQAVVPAGNHVAKLRCLTDAGGPIGMDEGGIQVVAVPN